MSKEYKDKIDKLVDDANKGNTSSTKELLEECNMWNAKIDELKNNRKAK
jgi:uncharacterized protein YdcH (DUF465 family)